MNNFLKDIFIHIDGVVMAPAYELMSKSEAFNRNKVINPNSKSYGAYAHVLCKILSSQKLLKLKAGDSNQFVWTELGKAVLQNRKNFRGIRNYYLSAINILEGYDKPSNVDFSQIVHNFTKITQSYGSKSVITKHFEGAIITPILIYFSKTKNMDTLYLKLTSEFDNSLINFMKDIDFISQKKISEKGKYFFSKSYAYGVTSSYLRTLVQIEELCFNPETIGCIDKVHVSKRLKPKPKNTENHVDRALNVWGSGKSHKTYFKYIDEYIEYIFNLPIKNQPKGIADMGCGDGSFLLHLFNLIKYRTIRGKMLKSYPITLIGADYNQAALDQTKITFSNSTIKPLTLIADISKPNKFANDLKKNHSVNISDFLNVRSFLDHNRTYKQFNKLNDLSFKNKTSNSFVWRGKYLNKNDMQNNLVNHFKSWKKYISKYGLLVLELHCIDLNEIYRNIGKIPMTAYLGTHGFSDQFIIEYEVYRECLEKAGLQLSEKFEKFFPNEDKKMISINLIT